MCDYCKNTNYPKKHNSYYNAIFHYKPRTETNYAFEWLVPCLNEGRQSRESFINGVWVNKQDLENARKSLEKNESQV